MDAHEVASTAVRDVRCVRMFEGHEVPWQRDDPCSHFVVMIMLSEPLHDFDGGRMMVHGGACVADTDAMPVDLNRGDAVIYCAPRLDHSIQRVDEGERAMCVLELAASPEQAAPLPSPPPQSPPPAVPAGDEGIVV